MRMKLNFSLILILTFILTAIFGNHCINLCNSVCTMLNSVKIVLRQTANK